ncbi:hypothetical protein PAXRUDRAFT_35129 [Paxillus rubicundulus Ve08.2h10]|uniref:CxC5 like cysteine cluster associated with KDZ domain-containing protein n=1 Tax=Paxillus rubicundulus Ve08.2h10 TaxID=930991 RepID=A0A0D0DSC8_9AGAM|nr:hypothetical protein PAXRUDRAFT_35129 [Paxillus rubicundulus Ve08.2h10]
MTELRKVKAQRIVLYTLNSGNQPTWAVHLYFPDCHCNYHVNFYICDGQCTYYPGLLTYLQVSKHHFVEHRLAEMWTNQHLIEHVWDAFFLLILICDHATHSLLLVIPHVGL